MTETKELIMWIKKLIQRWDDGEISDGFLLAELELAVCDRC
jgi:hypothetical protein